MPKSTHLLLVLLSLVVCGVQIGSVSAATTVNSLLDFLDSTAAVPIFAAGNVSSLAIYAPFYDSNNDSKADNLACSPFPQTFAAEASGKAVMVTRGSCPFQTKADHAVAAGATAVMVVNNVNGLFSMIVQSTVPVFLLDPEQLGANYGDIVNRTAGKTFTVSWGPAIGYTGTPRQGELPLGLGILQISTGNVTLKSKSAPFSFVAGWKVLETTRGSDRNYLWLANPDNSQNITVYDVSDPANPVLKAQFKPQTKSWLSFDEFDFLKVNATTYLLYVQSVDDGEWLVLDVSNLQNGVEPPALVAVPSTIENKGFERTIRWVFAANGTIEGKDANQIVVYNNSLTNPAILSTFVDPTPQGGNASDNGAAPNQFISNSDGSLLFAAWGADGTTGYKVLSGAPYLQKFATVYGTVGRADYTIGASSLSYALTQDVLLVGNAAINDSAVVNAYKINANDGSIVGTPQVFVYPSCGAAAYPAVCSESFPVMQHSVVNSTEWVSVDHDRGVDLYQLNPAGKLVEIGNFASRCSFVQFVGFVANSPLVINGLSPKCTCPTLTGACPLQIRLEVTTNNSTNTPSSTSTNTPTPTHSSSAQIVVSLVGAAMFALVLSFF